MKKSILFALAFFISWVIYSQSVEGVVTDQEGLPMIGVNVMNKNANSFTMTDFDGKFRIEISGEDILTFSYIGYETLTVTSKGDYMSVVMTEKSLGLQEIIVIGYGTKKAGSGFRYCKTFN